MFESFVVNFTLAVGVVCFFSWKSRQIFFEEASRIGTKLLLIRIAGESGSGLITGAIFHRCNCCPFNCQAPTGRHRVNKTHNEETSLRVEIFFS